MILSAQTIRRLGLVSPLHERGVAHGMTFGLSACGVDLTLGESVILPPKTQVNSFVRERIALPANIRGKIENKSTLARMGIDASATTNAEPGWEGYLTVEIYNRGWWIKRLRKGTPIIQIVFEYLDEPTERPYAGKYQGQPARAIGAILEGN
ncbi:dCTP deaminase [Pseudochelatococcus lubricantis]|uniref:dCTP deaminase n=1 Tax=Pseudochelatococcus lubricantis TaxID=1538102 RepID=A0ABX0V047_9HYPH|nr:deoxycytidine triphosphate deaminase [Pseudochelatococcus lubricantis]NIJ57205.1 dCTP deaminase [Pseudochelatococcus lubricantis]